MIVADALAGGGGDDILGNLTAPIDFQIGKHSMLRMSIWVSLLTFELFIVDALVLYGDPRHAPHQPYDEGFNTSSVTGVSHDLYLSSLCTIINPSQTQKYPRPKFQVQHLTKYYGNVIQDYCNVGDPVCASGDNITAHLVYPEIWDTTAAAWVQGMLDKA